MNNLTNLHKNSNGLAERINELHALVQKYKIDIIIHKQNIPQTKSNQTIKIPNYFVHRNDLPSIKGSLTHAETVIFVHCQIVHNPLKTQTSLSTSFKVQFNNIEIQISAVYNL